MLHPRSSRRVWMRSLMDGSIGAVRRGISGRSPGRGRGGGRASTPGHQGNGSATRPAARFSADTARQPARCPVLAVRPRLGVKGSSGSAAHDQQRRSSLMRRRVAASGGTWRSSARLTARPPGVPPARTSAGSAPPPGSAAPSGVRPRTPRARAAPDRLPLPGREPVARQRSDISGRLHRGTGGTERAGVRGHAGSVHGGGVQHRHGTLVPDGRTFCRGRNLLPSDLNI